MSSGVQIFNASGTLVWDSSTVVGGVLADVRLYTAASTGTLTYPVFAGKSARIIPLLVNNDAGTNGVTVDTSLGYPRVTIVAASTDRKFAVEVY